MKCNPLRWLWGLLPLAVWTWITVLGEHERVEADLKSRTEEALADAGLSWAKTNFSGRDGILSGRALEDSEPQSALQTAMNVYGVRIVDPQTDLIRMVDNYEWKAAIRDDATIALTGFVPNEKTRKAIVGVVKANFPKSLIQDRMELARGVPTRDVWLGGVGFGLKQLAGLKSGQVQLAGLDISLTGEAADLASYKSVKTAMRSHLPGGIKLVSDKIRPPVVSPYQWGAHRDGNKIVLGGFVPSDQVRDELMAHAKSVFPGAAVADRMEPGEGAPKGYVGAAKAVIDQLALLNAGEARMQAMQINVTGKAENEAVAARFRQGLLAKLPNTFRAADVIEYPKPSPPPPPPPPPDNSAQIEAERAAAEARRMAAEQEARRMAAEQEARLKAEREAAEARRMATDQEARLKAEREAAEARRMAADQEARLKAEREAAEARRMAADQEARLKAEREAAEARRMAAEQEAKMKAELEAAEAKRRAAEAEARRKADEEARRKAEREAAELEAKRKADEAAAAAATARRAEADKCQTAMREVAKAGVIRFDRASASLDRVSHQTLDRLAQAANACPRLNIEIEGHTDAEGTPERNQGLSERRAQSVTSYLVDAGVESSRLSPIGYGETRPIAPNDTAENRAKNRRIEFSVKSE